MRAEREAKRRRTARSFFFVVVAVWPVTAVPFFGCYIPPARYVEMTVKPHSFSSRRLSVENGKKKYLHLSYNIPGTHRATFFFVKLSPARSRTSSSILFFFKAPEFEMCPCVWEGHHIISMVVDCLVGGREWEPTVLPPCRTHKISCHYIIPSRIG